MPKYSKIAPFDGMLGKYPDPFIAWIAGMTTEAVRQRRLVLKIEAFKPPRSGDLDAVGHLLGGMFDTEVAKLTGVTISTVRKRRLAAGIGPYVPESPLARYDGLLATMTDEALGKVAGVSKQAITARRASKGVASHRDQERAKAEAKKSRGDPALSVDS